MNVWGLALRAGAEPELLYRGGHRGGRRFFCGGQVQLRRDCAKPVQCNSRNTFNFVELWTGTNLFNFVELKGKSLHVQCIFKMNFIAKQILRVFDAFRQFKKIVGAACMQTNNRLSVTVSY